MLDPKVLLALTCLLAVAAVAVAAAVAAVAVVFVDVGFFSATFSNFGAVMVVREEIRPVEVVRQQPRRLQFDRQVRLSTIVTYLHFLHVVWPVSLVFFFFILILFFLVNNFFFWT